MEKLRCILRRDSGPESLVPLHLSSHKFTYSLPHICFLTLLPSPSILVIRVQVTPRYNFYVFWYVFGAQSSTLKGWGSLSSNSQPIRWLNVTVRGSVGPWGGAEGLQDVLEARVGPAYS